MSGEKEPVMQLYTEFKSFFFLKKGDKLKKKRKLHSALQYLLKLSNLKLNNNNNNNHSSSQQNSLTTESRWWMLSLNFIILHDKVRCWAAHKFPLHRFQYLVIFEKWPSHLFFFSRKRTAAKQLSFTLPKTENHLLLTGQCHKCPTIKSEYMLSSL